MMMDVFLSKSKTNTNGGANTEGGGTAQGTAALPPIQVQASIEGQWLWPCCGCGLRRRPATAPDRESDHRQGRGGAPVKIGSEECCRSVGASGPAALAAPARRREEEELGLA